MMRHTFTDRHGRLTLGTAARKERFLTAHVLVLITDTTMTWTSGRGRSRPKCMTILRLLLS